MPGPALHPTPRIVIIGCGFGGLEAARALRHVALQVTLVDRTNH
ncbi:MAG: NAD-binding protein, partial [Burkholderiaceae bacterium]